jgi:hypothetical protein
VRCAVASQLIRYQPPGFAFLTFQQPVKEAFGRTLIATGLNKNIDHVSVLVNGAPEILPLTLNIHEKLIQMPNVTQSAPSSPESPGILGSELPPPLSDGLVADHNLALFQEVFNISEAQAESVVEPNDMAYDLRWESISAIAGCLRIDQPSLHVSPQLDNTSPRYAGRLRPTSTTITVRVVILRLGKILQREEPLNRRSLVGSSRCSGSAGLTIDTSAEPPEFPSSVNRTTLKRMRRPRLFACAETSRGRATLIQFEFSVRTI